MLLFRCAYLKHLCVIENRGLMKPGIFKRRQVLTAYVLFDSGKCKACWKCLEKCPENVFGRVNLPWHKHALIVNGSNCTGCLKCVLVCAFDALSRIPMIG